MSRNDLSCYTDMAEKQSCLKCAELRLQLTQKLEEITTERRKVEELEVSRQTISKITSDLATKYNKQQDELREALRLLVTGDAWSAKEMLEEML